MAVLKTQQEIIVETTPVFQKNLAAYQQGFPIICNEGGSRSSKSYSILQLLCGIAKQEKGKRISIVSHSLPHVKRGVYRDFKNIMQEIGWWKEDQWRATDFVYTFPNGSYIELFGLEDEGKARGPGRDILFINEANLITKPLFDQLAMRTTGQIFLDWNPADFNSWVYEIADNPKNKNIHSTYKDNIHNLSKAQIEYIEHYKTLPDDFMWKVYGLGLRGAAKELIYTTWKYYEDEVKGDVFYGLDFGYTNPTALVKVTHHEGSNYVEEILYQSSLTVPELINHLKQSIKGKPPIYCDAAEPKTIEEIYKAGFNVIPSDKDVWAGIVGVKSYPLFVRHGSTNLIHEIQGYKWKKDKNDNILEEPIKANDHALDAMRYAIFTHLTKPVEANYMIGKNGEVIKF
jgi:phage terminase large subunit